MYRILTSNLTLAGLLALAAVLSFLASLPVVGVLTGGMAAVALFVADSDGVLRMSAGDCAELEEYEEELRARRRRQSPGGSGTLILYNREGKVWPYGRGIVVHADYDKTRRFLRLKLHSTTGMVERQEYVGTAAELWDALVAAQHDADADQAEKERK